MPSHTRPRRSMPVRSSHDAVHLLRLTVSIPLVHETHAFLLDADGHGGLVVCFEDTEPVDSVVPITEVMCRTGERVPDMCSLVVATVRPEVGLVAGDIDRWLEASDIAESHGITLLEWYVADRTGFHCPRELLGESPRWSQ